MAFCALIVCTVKLPNFGLMKPRFAEPDAAIVLWSSSLMVNTLLADLLLATLLATVNLLRVVSFSEALHSLSRQLMLLISQTVEQGV